MHDDSPGALEARQALEKEGIPFSPAGLLECISKGDGRAVRSLIQGGLTPADVAAEGLDPVLAAAGTDHGDVITVLASSGFPLDGRDASGRTPLMIAGHNLHESAARALIAAGAPLDSTGPDGRTALMQATADDQVGLIEVLLENHAKPDLLDGSGMTALMIGTVERHAQAVEALLLGGASLGIRSGEGLTAHELAVKHRVADAMRILRQAEAGTLKPVSETKHARRRLTRRIRTVADSRRLRWIAGIAIAAMIVATVVNLSGIATPQVELPATLDPPPAEAAEAALRFGIEEIEAFRLTNGRLPATLTETNLADRSEFSYRALPDGQGFELTVTQDSVTRRYQPPAGPIAVPAAAGAIQKGDQR